MAKKNKKEEKKSQQQINYENLQSGISIIDTHPLFGGCFYCNIRDDGRSLGKEVYAVVTLDGEILLNENKYLLPKQWAYVIAHNILHLAFGHFDADKMPGYFITDELGKKIKKTEFIPLLWNMACDIYVDKFLADIKFGQSIHDKIENTFSGGLDDEIKIYEYLLENGITGAGNTFGTSAMGKCDMIGLNTPVIYEENKGEYYHYTR